MKWDSKCQGLCRAFAPVDGNCQEQRMLQLLFYPACTLCEVGWGSWGPGLSPALQPSVMFRTALSVGSGGIGDWWGSMWQTKLSVLLPHIGSRLIPSCPSCSSRNCLAGSVFTECAAFCVANCVFTANPVNKTLPQRGVETSDRTWILGWSF